MRELLLLFLFFYLDGSSFDEQQMLHNIKEERMETYRMCNQRICVMNRRIILSSVISEQSDDIKRERARLVQDRNKLLEVMEHLESED